MNRNSVGCFCFAFLCFLRRFGESKRWKRNITHWKCSKSPQNCKGNEEMHNKSNVRNFYSKPVRIFSLYILPVLPPHNSFHFDRGVRLTLLLRAWDTCGCIMEFEIRGVFCSHTGTHALFAFSQLVCKQFSRGRFRASILAAGPRTNGNRNLTVPFVGLILLLVLD